MNGIRAEVGRINNDSADLVMLPRRSLGHTRDELVEVKHCNVDLRAWTEEKNRKN